MSMHLVVIAVLLVTSIAQSAIVLSRDGKSEYVIVLADDAIAPEQTAAGELRDTLKRVTGAELPIVKQSDLLGAEAPQILVGTGADRSDLGYDGIVIKTSGKNLIFTGGRPRGTLYAVNTFLEDIVGVRWWTSSESTIPKKPTLEIPDLDLKHVPKLISREVYNSDALNDHALFATRMKLNGHMTQIPPELGGHYTLIGWCHTSFELVPPDKYFAEHPEWFAMLAGKRQTGSQLCLTNSEMKRVLIRHALRKIRKNPDAGIISISQNDCLGACECDACQAVVTEEGSQSGPWIRLCNEAAAAINKEFPDFLVETLAYQYTRKPPTRTKPSKNVLVRLCSIECDFSHPLSGESNKSFGDDLRGWAKMAPNLFVWNYVTNFSNYLIPHPNQTAFADDLRFFADHHVVGVFEQGDAFNGLAGDMLPLRTWVLAHLLWDPTKDQDKLRQEFLTGYFGPAGAPMGAYLDLVNAPSNDPAFRIGCYNQETSFLSDETLAKANQLFDDAEKVAAGDADVLRRVKRERLVLEHVNLLRHDFSGTTLADYNAKVRDWSTRAKTAGVKHFSEGQAFDAYLPTLLARGRRFFPPKLPKAGAELPDGQFDMQEDRFNLINAPELARLVDDPKASNGRAARMPGERTDWAVQLPVTPESKFIGPGPWECWIVVRVDAKKKKGAAFQYGVQSAGSPIAHEKIDLATAGDGEYHTLGVILDELHPGSYFWVAPSGHKNGVEAVYVDRIFIQKQAAK